MPNPLLSVPVVRSTNDQGGGKPANPLLGIPAVALPKRPLALGDRLADGVQDIGRIGLALPALGEQVAQLFLGDQGDEGQPFSSTLRDMSLTEASQEQARNAEFAPPSLANQVAGSAVRSAPTMIPAMALAPVAAGAGLGNLAVNAAAAAPGGLATFGQTLGQDMNDPRITPGGRLIRALGQAALETGGELTPMGRLGLGPEAALARRLAGQGTAPTLAKAIGEILAQGGQEAITGGTQSALADVTSPDGFNLRDLVANAGRQSLEGGLAGLLIGGGMAGAHPAMDAAGKIQANVAKALLASQLRTGSPILDSAQQASTEASAPAPGGPDAATLIDRAIVARQVRQGIPQDFTPAPMPAATAPVEPGPGGYPEAQPGDMTAADSAAQIAQAFANLPQDTQQQVVQGLAGLFQPPAQAAQEVPSAETVPPAPAAVAPGPVPGVAPETVGALATPPPVAPQPQATAATSVARRDRTADADESAPDAPAEPTSDTVTIRWSNGAVDERQIRRLSPKVIANLWRGNPTSPGRTKQIELSREQVLRLGGTIDGRGNGTVYDGYDAIPVQIVAHQQAPAAQPAPVAGAPAPSPSASAVAGGYPVGARVRFTRGAKKGTEATVSGVTATGRPILRTDDGKPLGGKFGITPENLEVVNVSGNSPVAQSPGPVSDAGGNRLPHRGGRPGGASDDVVKAPFSAIAESTPSTAETKRGEAAQPAGPALFGHAQAVSAEPARRQTEEPAPVATGAASALGVRTAAVAGGGTKLGDGVSAGATTAENKPAAQARTNPAVARLRQNAATMNAKAEEDLGRDRLSNTRKRAAQAASAIRDANQRKADATTAQNVADALERGDVQHLGGVQSMADVVALRRMLDNAVMSSRQASPERMKWMDNHSNIDASNPTDAEIRSGIRGDPVAFSVHGEWVREALNEIKGERGAPAIRRDIGSYIGERYRAVTTDQIEALRALAGMSKRWGDNMKHAMETPTRLRRLGLNDADKLRDALVELNQLRAAVAGESKAAKLEREIRFHKITGFFPTPPALADEAVRKADIQPGMRVLEPEGGKGDLAQRAEAAGGKVDVAETQESLREILTAKGFNLVGRDMLEIQPPADGPVYDRIVMNPPFENGQDREHVRHAFDLLKPGGRLVAIMSTGPFWRSFKADQEFKAWSESVGAVVEDNEQGAFAGKDSFRQTGVNTVTVTIDKPTVSTPSSPVTVTQAQPLAAPPVRGDQTGRAGQTPSGASPEVGTSTEAVPERPRPMTEERAAEAVAAHAQDREEARKRQIALDMADRQVRVFYQAGGQKLAEVMAGIRDGIHNLRVLSEMSEGKALDRLTIAQIQKRVEALAKRQKKNVAAIRWSNRAGIPFRLVLLELPQAANDNPVQSMTWSITRAAEESGGVVSAPSIYNPDAADAAKAWSAKVHEAQFAGSPEDTVQQSEPVPAPDAPEAPASDPRASDNQQSRTPTKDAENPTENRKVDDPRATVRVADSLYRAVNAAADDRFGEVRIVRESTAFDGMDRLRVYGKNGAEAATTEFYPPALDAAMREIGIDISTGGGRFRVDEISSTLESATNALAKGSLKARTIGTVKREGYAKDPAMPEKGRNEVPAADLKAYSQRDAESRPVIIDLEAINKDMQVGRVVAVPGGWRFVAPAGRGIGIRSATAEEARAHEGRAEGYFTGVDPLTGEPQIVLIPGRTGAFTVNHELVHHARRLGVLTDAHLDALGRIGAKHGIAAKWGKAYRAAKPDITAAELREEIAAKTVEAIKAGDIPLKPGFVQRFLDWVADLARAAVGLPKSERRLARDVVEGTIFAGGQEPAAAPVAGDQVFSLADDGESEKRTPQERLEAARQGVKPGDTPTTDPTMLEEFRRHFRHLDPAKHAEAIAIIRELEARLDAATGQAERIILGHVDGLTREQAEAFNDRLVLEDVLRQIEAGEFDGGPTEDGRTAAQIGEDIQRDLAKAIERGGKPAAEAYAKRRTFQEQHTRALVDADLLAPEALDDPRYYHRQVLAHLGERQGMGLGGSDVRNRTRGFQRGRAGGTAADIPFYGDEEAQRDFNANYAQAEFEYLAQSVQELARADALERLDARYNQMRAAKAEAKARNRAAMDELWVKEHTVAETGERDEEAIAEGWDKHWRSLIARNNARLAEMAMWGSFGGPYADVWQELADARREWLAYLDDHDLDPKEYPFTFDHPAWWKALSWLAAHQDVIVSMSDPKTGKTWEEKPAINALAIFKAVAEREEHVKETLGRDYQTWQDVAKGMPGMVLWQPEEGLQLVPGWAATDQVIANALRKAGVDDATVADALPPAAPVGHALKRGMIVMGKKPEWLIPEALAKQLNDMRRVPDLNALGRIAETWSRRWKLWMLHQPMRVLKYQLNNLVGDLDVALTQPAILREVARDRMQVARDLWAYTHGKTLDPKTEAQMRRAQAMGLFDSGVSAAELPDVDKLPALRALFGQGWDTGWAGIPEAARRYFDSAQRFGRWREAIMRVSAARHFYREASPSRRRYAASRKDELDQLYDRWQALSDRIDAIARRSSPSASDGAQVREAESEIADLHATIAAKLARELLGDYGNLSHAGQKLRRFLIPFWSWAEINAPRYARLVRNARYEGGGGAGRALGASAAMAGGVAVRAAALSGMVFGWNAMMKAVLGIGDDDDPNKEADMSKLMIILGKGGDGKVYGVRVAGALSDALGWLDLDNAWKHAKDLAIGYREGRLAQAGMDVAGDMLAAPANRIAQGLSPIIKVPIEQATRRQLFPNAFAPRPLGDRWGHLADSIGVGPAYRAATDRSSIGNAAGGVLLVTHDPSAAAAHRVRLDAEGWAQRNGRTTKAGGGVPSEQREALGQAKAAHARGEEARASRWLRRYFELGGRPSYLGSSKAAMHPLSVLLQEDRAAYLKSLDPARRADYDKALRRWRELWEQDDGMAALAARVFRGSVQ